MTDLKPCPLPGCGAPAEPTGQARISCSSRACYMHYSAVPAIAWNALPRVTLTGVGEWEHIKCDTCRQPIKRLGYVPLNPQRAVCEFCADAYARGTMEEICTEYRRALAALENRRKLAALEKKPMTDLKPDTGIKPCPLCQKEPTQVLNLVTCYTLNCLFAEHGCEEEAWQLLPRVVPNARELLDRLCVANRRYDGEWNSYQLLNEARAACLAAMVVVPVTADIIGAALMNRGWGEAATCAVEKGVREALAALEKKP